MLPKGSYHTIDVQRHVGETSVRFRFGTGLVLCVEGDLCFDGEWQFVLKTTNGLWAFRAEDVVQMSEEGMTVQA